MAGTIREKGRSQWAGWVIGSASLFRLVVGAGLALSAQQAVGRGGMAAILLALYLASLLYVVGSIGVVLFAAWWLAGRVRAWGKGASGRRKFLVEPRTEGPILDLLNRAGVVVLQADHPARAMTETTRPVHPKSPEECDGQGGSR